MVVVDDFVLFLAAWSADLVAGVVADVDFAVPVFAVSGFAAVDFILDSVLVVVVLVVVVLAAEAGLAVLVVVEVLAEAFTGTAPGAEHFVNLPEASRHFWPAVLVASGHLVNLPEASRHWAAWAWPAVSTSAAAAAAKKNEERCMVLPSEWLSDSPSEPSPREPVPQSSR